MFTTYPCKYFTVKGVEPAMEWLLSKTDDDTLDDPLSEEEEEEEEAGALVNNPYIYLW